MSLAIIDLGVGNTGSVVRAFRKLGASPVVVNHADQLVGASRVVLPGVGAFGDVMALMQLGDWVSAIQGVACRGTPLLGICLGMQLLADQGHEGGLFSGLGLIPGKVVRLDSLGCGERVPHVGWNTVTPIFPHPLMQGLEAPQDYYFVHGYAFHPDVSGDVLACSDYGISFPAVVGRDNVLGVQFHPEKSSKSGLRLLSNFLALPSC